MKRIIALLLGAVTFAVCSCEQHYHAHRTYRSYGSGSSYRLGPAPSGGHGIDAVGQPDTYSQ
jgi:hypothetical protein